MAYSLFSSTGNLDDDAGTVIDGPIYAVAEPAR